MRQTFSYADAMALLGGESPAVAGLDRALGGALFVATGGGSELVSSILGARGEAIRVGNQLVSSVRDRVRGFTRHDRTQRLYAAHSVIVITAFWQAFEELDFSFTLSDLGLTRIDQLQMARVQTGSVEGADLVEALLYTNLPFPSPTIPFEEVREALRSRYQRYAFELQRFMQGLAVWDELNATVQSVTRSKLQNELSNRAIKHYEIQYRRLAVDVPEFAWWANQQEHGATRGRVNDLRQSLTNLEEMLRKLPIGSRLEGWREALAVAHQGALDRPILAEWEISAGVAMPKLRVAYVDPDFRLGGALGASSPANEAYWGSAPLRTDLAQFLAGHLTTSLATEAPLLILGQPGAGKSVLTRVIAARLPAEDFLPIRVELREVPADSDLQEQIEYGIRSATGRSIHWPELVSAASGALPIVMLDGFDELLQATGVSQTDYLDRVARFQQREASQGRRVAVMVTSRTSVADRAKIPAGSVLVRLEPFRQSHIEQWLRVWNSANAANFDDREVAPFAVETALRYSDLAGHPLLLLMLALYDADANVLQRTDEQIDEVELYERLLSTFAEREIRKNYEGSPDERIRDLVEDELLRLSVVAFAMFNRGRQWTTAAELDADLEALLGRQSAQPAGFRAPLSRWEAVLGRFFFIQRAQAMRDGARLSTYEFLHATFGEYLVARLVHRVVLDLAEQGRAIAKAALGGGAPPDGLIYALLSFTTLTARNSILQFLQLMAARLTEEQASVREIPTSLFRRIDFRVDDRYSKYEPLNLPSPSRYGRFGINLILLAAAYCGKVTARTLLPASGDVIQAWRRHALLWQSSLAPEEWSSLLQLVSIERHYTPDGRDLTLFLGAEEKDAEAVDLSWTFASDEVRGSLYQTIARRAALVCDRDEDVVAHIFEPILAVLGDFSDAYAPRGQVGQPLEDGNGSPARTVSNALISLWLASETKAPKIDVYHTYQSVIQPLEDGLFDLDEDITGRIFTMLLTRLSADAGLLATDEFVSILGFVITFKSRTVRQGILVIEAILNHLTTYAPPEGPDAAELRHITSFLLRTQPFLWLYWFVGLHELGKTLPSGVVSDLPWVALLAGTGAGGKSLTEPLQYTDRRVLARAGWLLQCRYNVTLEDLVKAQEGRPPKSETDWEMLNDLWADYAPASENKPALGEDRH